MVTGPATPCRCIASEQLPPKPPGVPARPPPKRSPPSRRVAPLTGGSPPRGAHRPSRRRRFPRTDVATTGIRGPGRQRLIRQLCRNLYSCTNSWRRPNCHGGWLPPEPPGAPARTNHSADTRQRSSTRSKSRTGCSQADSYAFQPTPSLCVIQPGTGVRVSGSPLGGRAHSR